MSAPAQQLTKKDFVPDQEVRWCPGCVDYVILAQLQKVFPTLGIPRENFAIVSGIGCSSRLPYYMNTYGVHGIHGRAPGIATGLKLARPELSVWVVTGDGDALAIGGNHLMHALRRNASLKILLLNNRIYGLTKGQTSPTSEFGKKTKSTPAGSVEYPLRPVDVALGAGATFVARVMGNDPQMVPEVLRRAAKHDGAAFIEFFQNCVIFNDGAFDSLSEPATKADMQLRLEHGKPLRFGKDGCKGIVMDESGQPRVVPVSEVAPSRLLVHDETSDTLPALLSRLNPPDFPLPLGILRAVEREPYERMVHQQIADARAARPTTLEKVLNEGQTWTVPGIPSPTKG